MATAKKLPSGKYRCRASYTDEFGNYKTKSFTAATKKEAENLASNFIMEREHKAKPENKTLGELADAFLESKSEILSPSTLRGYKSIRNNAFKSIIDVRLGILTKELYQKAVNEYAKGRSPKTVLSAHTFFNNLLKENDIFVGEKATLPRKVKKETAKAEQASAEEPKQVEMPVPQPTVSVQPITPVPVQRIDGYAAPEDQLSEALIREVMKRVGMQTRINLENAKKLIEKIEQEAERRGAKAVIAICTPEGNPVAVHAMDGAFLVSFEAAMKKAYTSVAVQMPTIELAKMGQPGQTFYGVDKLKDVVTFGGGVPIKDVNRIIGGIGVSGGTGEEDHSLAQYGASLYLLNHEIV